MAELYRHAIVACARWESESLPEWLQYHRQIGFDHVYLYCNDDDPTACYQAVLPFVTGPAPFVTFVAFPFVGLQGEMYKHFLKHHMHEVRWFIILDADEFLVFRQDGSVRGFMAARQDAADMIVFNSFVFGHAGYRQRPAGSVLLNYTRRGAELDHAVRIMTRARSLDVAQAVGAGDLRFWETWNFAGTKLIRARNVIGDDMGAYLAAGYDAARGYLDQGDTAQRIAATAVVHHYRFRSEDDIERRLRRGTTGDFQEQLAFKRLLDAGRLADFLRPFSEVEDTTLRDYWRYVLDSVRLTAIVARPASPNIALGKPALQSSIGPWSRGATREADAGRAVSGAFSGGYNCRTAEEDSPWWQVDLLSGHTIRQIQIFNRIDTVAHRQRTSRFALETSMDGVSWIPLYQTGNPLSFGGADGEPLIWTSEKGVFARYFRFRLLSRAVLQIDAVEIYETPVERIAIDPASYGTLTEAIVRNTVTSPRA